MSQLITPFQSTLLALIPFAAETFDITHDTEEPVSAEISSPLYQTVNQIALIRNAVFVSTLVTYHFCQATKNELLTDDTNYTSATFSMLGLAVTTFTTKLLYDTTSHLRETLNNLSTEYLWSVF